MIGFLLHLNEKSYFAISNAKSIYAIVYKKDISVFTSNRRAVNRYLI